MHLVYVVHDSPGRLRLRLPYLRHTPEAVDPLADHLSELEGLEEVQIRPYTGSVLCMYDPWAITTDKIIGAVRSHTGIEIVLQPGEHDPAEEIELARHALDNGSDLARTFATFFKGMNLEVLRATGGRVDLGTLAAATFVTAGATEVISTGKLPMPPWFNLGWWAFNMFTTLEQKAIDRAPAPEPISDAREASHP